ncbi:TonB-dependent receptor [Pedobacter sp. P351]|uniref:SusC/RagA family TonB-linked outer membrane protein n=1 Tax=Pedobacter superstes TaxID=3133441 RepID=UPI003096A6DF
MFHFTYWKDRMNIARLPQNLSKASTCATVILVMTIFALPMSTSALPNLKISRHLKVDPVTITGTVKDDNGDPLPGVTVRVKGSNIAVVTATNGKYSIRVPDGNSVLEFSFIGFASKEAKVDNRLVIDVALAEDARLLNEVIVNVGYGTVTRERMAGSVSSVRAKDIADFPVSSAAEALAGKLAGVSVAATEGAPGADIKILVRGGTSITQDNSPLYIVDGVPLERALSIISPSEIAAIDVLKDVASTAIYGARGANGVVIITTKTGKAGKTLVSFDTYAGVRNITNYIDMLSPYDYVKAQYDMNMIHFGGGLITDTATVNGFRRRYGNVEDFEIYKSFPSVNWQERVFGRKAFSNTQILTVMGGTRSSTFNFSVNRTDEDGIMLGSNLGRTFATFRFDNEISKRFKVGVNVRYSDQLVTGSGTSTSGSNAGLQNSARFQPFEGVSNAQTRSDDAFFEDRIDLSTPVTAALRDQRLNRNRDLITSGYLNVNIGPQWTFRSNIGYRNGDSKNDAFRGVVQYEVSNFSRFGTYKDQPFIDLSSSRSVGITNTNTLNYRGSFLKDHKIEALLGQEINHVNSDSYSQNIRFFPSNVTWEEAFGNVQAANAPPGFVQNMPVNNVQSERLFSFFGRTMYSFKERYNLNLSLRHDGSSKFGPENRWGTFPSAQAAWRLSEEPFFKDLGLKWVGNVKFRASYGTAGNNRINSDRLYATIYATSSSAGGYADSDNSQTAGLYPTALENPGLKWETIVSRNLGLDMDLFGNRLTASVDLYSNTANDLLLNTNVPQQIGYTSQTQNIGSTRNRGVELQLNSQLFKTRHLNYNTSFNISFNKNIVLKLNQGNSTTYGYGLASGTPSISGNDFWVQVGQPVGLYYGFVADGLYTLDDFDRTFYESELAAGRRTWRLKPGVPNAGSNAALNQGIFPGVLKLKDLNGDGNITVDDRTVIGKAQPKFFGGWNHQLNFRSFDMSLFMNFSYGNKTYNANKSIFRSAVQVNGNNFHADTKDRWTYFDQKGVVITKWEDMQAANVDTKTYGITYGNPVPLSDAIEDASFLRITNLTLGYTLPEKLISRTKVISKFRMYATVNNLRTFTRYKGFDPEANTRFSPLTPGVDYNAYPRNRYMLAGLNVTF